MTKDSTMPDKSINASDRLETAIIDSIYYGTGTILVSSEGVRRIDPDYLYNNAPATGLNPTHSTETAI